MIFEEKMESMMKLNEIMQNEILIDGILKEAAEGYGDLVAAALIHRVSVRSLQSRAVELRDLKATWIL
jgi:hypothetical protein